METSKSTIHVLSAELASNREELANLKNMVWLQAEFADMQKHLEAVILQNVELHRLTARHTLDTDSLPPAPASGWPAATTSQEDVFKSRSHADDDPNAKLRRTEADLQAQRRLAAAQLARGPRPPPARRAGPPKRRARVPAARPRRRDPPRPR
eukprot:CAMPEP_0172179402 /NCGR_PEP_ID=MMETSP1050-20130122/16597_1 /TAXON_ID=233186 /ORGANISM="Cryptomonas curvata, Strain CCAP979/52" /LENGTH=152 /DNA_ID=CAMNT_0012852279 /DNA_START=500 /DNA_END=954 /DNA_ORIENTATION=-